MELKTQIIVAVFSGLAGILLGIMMVVFAVCYRRRSLTITHGHTVKYRKNDRNEEADDRVSMYLGQRHSRINEHYSSASDGSFSEQYEVEVRPKLHRAKLSKRSGGAARDSSDKRRKSFDNDNEENYIDFSGRRKETLTMRIPRPHTWSNEYREERETQSKMGRHSGTFETHHIPRPIIRPYKSELFEDTGSTYDYISHVDHQTIEIMSSQRSSRNDEFEIF